MSHFFGVGGNPFATPVGQMIEKATDGTQASENWALFMDVCDLVNETEEGPKDAIKAIRKRLSQNAGKNFQIVMFTLTLLEACVKNCGRRLHIQIAHKDFLQEMVKIIGPKNDPPQVVQEKVLSLIQTWADAFQGIPELKEVNKVYQELRNKGIEFPATDLDNMAPIHTPARTMPETDAIIQRSASARVQHQPTRSPPRAHTLPYPGGLGPHGVPPVPQQQVPTGPVMLAPEQLAKLKSELDIVQQNINVFSEMLTEITPGQEHPNDLELLQDLSRTCKEMQKRIMELIERVQNEEVTGELLRVNDELNNVFLRYERFERIRSSHMASSTVNAARPAGAAAQAAQTKMRTNIFRFNALVDGGTFISCNSLIKDLCQSGYISVAELILQLIKDQCGLESPVASVAQTANHASPPYPGTESSVGNLIDLGDTDVPAAPRTPNKTNDISTQLEDLNICTTSVSGTLSQLDTVSGANTGAGVGADDFDMFAQSRRSFDQNKQVPAGSAYANQVYDQYPGGLGPAMAARTGPNPEGALKENEFDEMEKWLRENPGEEPPQSQESATSSEFERFLAERAKAAETLPDVPGNTQQQQQSGRPGRQLQKDETENALFSL
ncbi:hypothetical protein LSH36_6g13051 [Paralvinella palmiformis]|uniref:TOM1-like protein 2 n=1 Tax=Paralvinella palmiformis TaxID=53620 RepID=A0AAD9KFN2_9ANNE|nr:hypothetical protein LSH36_6g13051 [Paralvinella palmiformis]